MDHNDDGDQHAPSQMAIRVLKVLVNADLAVCRMKRKDNGKWETVLMVVELDEHGPRKTWPMAVLYDDDIAPHAVDLYHTPQGMEPSSGGVVSNSDGEQNALDVANAMLEKLFGKKRDN